MDHAAQCLSCGKLVVPVNVRKTVDKSMPLFKGME